MIIHHNKMSKTLSSRLHAVLSLIHAKRPLLEYEVISAHPITNEAKHVRVWQDGQFLGSIDASHSKYSPTDGKTHTWYAVTCDNIRKSRGANKNMKFSKDAKTAARDVIELFTKKPLSSLGETLIKNVKDMVNLLHDRIESNYKNSINFSSHVLTNYFVDLHLGKTVPIPKLIEDQIVSKELLRKRENLEVSSNVWNHCKNNHGYALKVMQDESLLFAHIGNPDTTSKHQSTYELNQYTQEKYTMLKLLEPNQFAADIGVKYEYDNGDTKEMWYFIVAGETKVIE